MPNLKSAKKALRQSRRRTTQNLRVKRHMKSATKLTREAAAHKDANVASLLKDAYQALDKAAKKGVIKKRAASRMKSRLAKAANAARA